MIKVYPKYKHSGVEWLGEVPEHWGKIELKWASVRYSGGTPDKSIHEYWEDGTIPWLNSGAVNDNYITEPTEYITKEAFQNSSAKWIPKDALVMALAGQGKTKGMVAQLGFRTTCNQSMAAIVPNEKLNPRMLYWWLTKNYFNIRNLAGGEARDGLNLDQLGSIPIPLPPLAEQQTIAAFLDHETGRIDALIAKKQRLLELLAEQRTALISRAVTKGLDASVKLKPSGVEWLDDVPEHWKVLPLKRIVAIPVTDGPHETPEILDEGIPFVSAEAIRANKIDFSKKRGYISESEHRRFCIKYHPKRDDIYMIKSGATTGNLAIVETDEEFSIWSPLAVVRVHKKKADARFVLAAMNSKEFQTSVQLFWSYGTQQNIGMNVIENLPIPLPPLPEQQDIAAFLDREMAKIDALSEKVTTVIERLKEYRTALISSAVTGKIDVREVI